MKQPILFLRLAEASDAKSILTLARALYESSVYSKYLNFSEETTLESFNNSLEMDKDKFITVLLMSEDNVVGFLSCSTTEQVFSKEKISLVLAFYILPEFKSLSSARKLLSAYYFWAKKVGCKVSMIGNLKDTMTVEEYRIKDLR